MANTGVTVRVVSNRLPQMPAQIKAICAAEVSKATFRIEADAKAKVAVKTGTLRRSIHSVFSNGGLKGIVGPSVLYGKFVEFGTRRMGARPYMRPAAERHLPAFAAAIRSALAGLPNGRGGGSVGAISSGAVSTPSAPAKKPKVSKPKKITLAAPKKPMARAPKPPKHFESSGFKAAQARHKAYQRASNRRRRKK